MNQLSMNTAPEKRRNGRGLGYKNNWAFSFQRGEKTNYQDTRESKGGGLQYLPMEKILAQEFHLTGGESARHNPFRRVNAMYGKQALLPLAKILVYSCYTKEQAGR